jgi:hypothetical protein
MWFTSIDDKYNLFCTDQLKVFLFDDKIYSQTSLCVNRD